MSFISNMIRGDHFREWLNRQYKRRLPRMADGCKDDNMSVECKRCGFCCHGAPGALAMEDVEAIAAQLNISPQRLFHKYLTLHDSGPDNKWRPHPIRKGQESEAGQRLSDRGSWDQGACIFYEEKDKVGTCSIYAVRPAQCNCDRTGKDSWPEAPSDKVLREWGHEEEKPHDDFYDSLSGIDDGDN